MPFLPNNADAYNLGLAGGERFQAIPDSTDYEILKAAMSLTGAVSTGCAVTAQGTPNNTVAVAAGVVIVNGANVNVSAVASLTITAAHATNNRRDIVTVNNAGTVAYTAGTAVASTSVPVKPAIPANSVVLAEVLVPAADTTISTDQIIDKRVISTVGGRTLGSARVETNNLGLTSTTAADIAGLSTTVIVGARPVNIKASIPGGKITNAGYVLLQIVESATTLAAWNLTMASGDLFTAAFETGPFQPSVGSHTYKVQYLVSVAGVDLYGGGGYVQTLDVVEE